MQRHIAVCGLACHECGAFQAYRDNDDAKRAQTAREWSKRFGVRIEPASIQCTGCDSTAGPVFSYCQVCDIRACGQKKGVPACAHCPDYACGMLEEFLARAPECKASLDAIRKGVSA